MKDLTWLKTALIAHRGLYKKDGTIPENSLLAFQLAINHGYAIECDLNITKDHEVVVFHDHHLKRLTGFDQKLSKVTYSELLNLKLLVSEEKIPRLVDLLSLVHGQVPLLIELKPLGDIKTLCHAFIEQMLNYQGTWAVFSFHPGVVWWFKKNYPDVIRGQISSYFEDDTHMKKPMKFLMKRLFFNHLTKPDFISYYIHNLPNKYVDKQKKKGLTVISYAAQSQKDFDAIKSLYDNVVFEYFIPEKNA